MRRVTRHEPLSRTTFERELLAWTARTGAEATVGDIDRHRKQTAWVHVRELGRLYHLNADSTHQGVQQYLAMLAVHRPLEWQIVANARGRANKVAFGPDAVVIPGFYFYVLD